MADSARQSYENLIARDARKAGTARPNQFDRCSAPTTAWVILGQWLQNKPRGDAKMPRGSVYQPQAPPYQCGHVHRGHQKMQL
jgi:hypothetical protein